MAKEEKTLLTQTDVSWLRTHPRTAKKRLRKAEIMDWLDTIFITGAAVLFILLFLVQIVIVDGNSMNPTLLNGERLAIAPKFFQADHGDIVVIKRDYGQEPIVKRVIATAGQTVDIDFEKGEVRVDNELMNEDYIAEPTYDDGGNRGIDFPVTVPKDSVFVMGDNRNQSLDSRYREIGMVQLDHIWGQVLFRVFPFGDMQRDT